LFVKVKKPRLIYLKTLYQLLSLDNSVGLTTRLMAGRPGVRIRFPIEEEDFSIVQTGSGAHPVSGTMGTRAVSPRVKRA
jgi:hypothetical protein